MIVINGFSIDVEVETIIEHLRNTTHYFKDVEEGVGNIMVTCPSHKNGQERNPSCGILTEDKITVDLKGQRKTHTAGKVHCFTCGYTASIGEMISHIHGYDDKGEFGNNWIFTRYASSEKGKRSINLNFDEPEVVVEKEEVEEIPKEELAKYTHTHTYMYERGLTDELILKFGIYANPQTHTIGFPIKDLNGRVVYMQRRLINSKRFINDQGPKGKVLFGLYEIHEMIRQGQAPEEVWVVESIFDAITCWKHNKPAVAILGVAMTQEQLQLLKSCPIRTVVLALDNDKAGHQGTKRLQQQLKDDKVLYTVEYPPGFKDINEIPDNILSQGLQKKWIF